MGSIVDKRVPKTITDLKNILFEVWDALDLATINALIQSVKPKLQQLLHNKGRQVHGYTKHVPGS